MTIYLTIFKNCIIGLYDTEYRNLIGYTFKKCWCALFWNLYKNTVLDF